MLERRDLLTALYWDPNGSAAGVGGGGNWDNTSARWTTDPDGLIGHVAWDDAAGDTAIFAGSIGTVTVNAADSGVSAAGLQFDAAGYKINGAAGNTLTMTGAAAVVSNSTTLDVGTVINATLVGVSGLSFFNSVSGTPDNTGIIQLGGNNSGLSGGLTINDGIRVQTGAGPSALGAGNVTVNSGGQLFVFGGGPYTNTLHLAGAGWEESGAGGNAYGALRLDNGVTWSGSIALTADAAIGSAIGSGTLSGQIGGAGELTFNPASNREIFITGTANDYSGGTVVNAGRVTLRANAKLGTGDVTVASGGQVFASAANTLANSFFIAGDGTNGPDTQPRGALRIEAGTNLTGPITLTADASIGSYSNGTGIVSGDISGPFDLTINKATSASPGTIIVTGANSYVATTIVSGTLRVGNGGTSGSLGTGVIANSGRLAFHRTDTTTLATFITGTGTVAVARGGKLSLASGSSITNNLLEAGDSSAVSLGSGTIDILPGASVNVAYLTVGNRAGQSGTVNQSGGTVNVTGGSGNVGDMTPGGLRIGHWPSETSQYNLSGGSLNVTNDISVGWDGTGIFTQTGGAASAGRLVINDGNTLNGTGSGTFTLNAGTFDLSSGGIATAGGPTSIQLAGGTLTASADWSESLPINLIGPTTIDTGGHNVTLNGNLTGSGSLTKTGVGTLTLAGNNSYTGTTTISAGTLQIGGGTSGTLGSGAVTNDGSLVFDRGDNLTVSNPIGGSGSLTQQGTGTLTLSGQNTFTGDVTVSAGTLIAAAGVNSTNATQGALGNGQATRTIAVGAEATLQFAADHVFGNQNSMPSTAIVVDGGTVTSSDGSFNTLGPVALDAGTLDSGAPNVVFGSFQLTAGLNAEGTGTSYLSARNVYLPAASPGIALANGARLEQTGNFDPTPMFGKSTVVTHGDGTRAITTGKREYRIVSTEFHKGESSAPYSPEFADLTPEVPDIAAGWLSAESLAKALQEALSFTFQVNGQTRSFGAGGDSKGFQIVPDMEPSPFGDFGIFSGQIGFEDWTDYDFNDAYITYTVAFRPATSEDPVPDCTCTCACSPANADSTGGAKTTSPGKLGLQNDSGTVNGNKIVKATGRLNPDQAVPDVVEVRLTFDGVLQPSVFLDPANLAPGDYYTAAAMADTSTLATGRYGWKMTLVSHYGDASVEEVIDGNQDVVNRTASEFGGGWWLPELDRLNLESGGVNLISGLNRAIWFTESGGNYTVESGNPTIASLVKNGDNSFMLTYSDGSTSAFDPSGLLTGRTDANGNMRAYAYADQDGDSVADELVSITDETGRTATFGYTAGKVSQITDFTGQTTTFAHTGDQLTSATEADPDGAGPQTGPVTAYGYNADGLLNQVTDPVGNVSQVFYDFTGRVSSVEQSCGGTTALQSYSTVGLPDLATIGYDADHPAPIVSTADTLEYQEDERGNPMQVVRDHYGNVTTEIDALGHVTRYIRDPNGLVTRMIEGDPDGAGPLGDLVTQFLYDPRGNVLQQIHPDGTSESWTYDATFGKPTSHTDELGRQTLFQIDATNGNLLGMTQVVGLVDDPINLETDDVTTSYTYTDGTGVAPAGLVETETDPLGRVTRYAYNAHALVTSILAAEGTPDETLTEFEYDAADNLTATIDPLGRRTEYAYDALDRMIQMTQPDPDGPSGTGFQPVTTYEYDARGNQRFVIDPLGNVTEYVYNERNWVEQKIEADPDGAGPLASPVTTFDYDCAGNLVSIIDPLGRETKFAYDTLNRMTTTTLPDPDDAGPLASPVTSQTFDALGNVLTRTDALGNVTNYRYDARNRLAEITQPDPGSTGFQPVSTYTYDAAGQLTSTTDPLGRVSTYEYDELGRTSKITQPDPDGAGSQAAPENLTSYDKSGNVLTRTDPLGNVTTYEFDDLNRLVRTTQPDPDGSGTGFQPVTEYGYDDASQLTSMTDPLGRVTTFEYDNLGRQISRTLPDPDGAGSQTSPVYVTTFDAAGNVLTQTDAMGNVTTYGYDHLYRRTSITQADPDGAGPLAAPVTNYEFDAAGQMVGMTDPEGRETTYTYDEVGRTIEVLSPDPDGAGAGLAPRMQYTFDAVGNLLSETDRLGNATSYDYDNLHRRTSETNANNETTSFTFDLAGSRLTLTDPEGNTTSWAYDGLNRVIEETNELDDTRYFEYDLAGNLAQKIDRNDRYTEYEYDNLHRRIEERWLDPTDDTSVIHTINWTYDTASQLTEAADSFADYDYVFDNLGRATSITGTLAGLTPVVTLAQQFNANGRRTQLAAAIGATDDFVNDYAFDNLNRLTQVTQQDVAGGNTVANKRVDFGYNAVGQFDTISRYKDLAGTTLAALSEYDYDDAGRLTSLAHKIAGGATVAGYTFGYDAANRITSFINTQYANEIATVNYDATGQLTGADRSGTADDELYDYDANGNRETANGATYTTSANNRLASDGTFTYQYDAEGNRTKRTNIATGDYRMFTWDHRNRLVAVTDFDSLGNELQRVEYAYDVDQHLVGRKVFLNGSSTANKSQHFVYDGNQMGLVMDDAGNVEHRVLYGPAVDQVFADENGVGDLFWMLMDNQNTVRDVAEYDLGTDTTTVANHIAFSSFGEKQSETNGALDVLSLEYTGRYTDPLTGLQWNLNRWYDPQVGRWLSEDPIGFDGQTNNLHEYVDNSPANHADPTGLMVAIPGYRQLAVYGSRELVGIELPRLTQLLRKGEAIGILEYSHTLPKRYVVYAYLSVDGYPSLDPSDFANPITVGPCAPVGVGVSIGSKLIKKCVGGLHHLATNKNWISTLRGGPWSPRFAKIFKKAGMTLDDAANKVQIPGHQGPHPEAYHRAIYDRLQAATKGLSGNAFKDALVSELNALADEAAQCGSDLNKLLIGG